MIEMFAASLLAGFAVGLVVGFVNISICRHMDEKR
jgi:NhaP-type Na+/H+ or K+/H+ antiporter